MFAALNTRALVENDQWVVHTYAVLKRLEATVSTLMEAEAGQRGYLLTGDSNDLEQCHCATRRLTAELAELRGLTRDNPAQQRRLDELEPLVHQTLADLRRPIDLRGAGELEAALEAVRAGREKADMQAVRRLVGAMDDDESQLLTVRAARSQAGARRALLAFGVAAAVAVAMLLLDFLLVHRAEYGVERLPEGVLPPPGQ